MNPQLQPLLLQRLLPPPTDGGLRMTRRDTVAMLALTAVYAAVALVNLGTLSAPETAWTPQAAGETVTIEFPQETAVSEFWVYGNIADGGTLLLRADDAQTLDAALRIYPGVAAVDAPFAPGWGAVRI